MFSLKHYNRAYFITSVGRYWAVCFSTVECTISVTTKEQVLFASTWIATYFRASFACLSLSLEVTIIKATLIKCIFNPTWLVVALWPHPAHPFTLLSCQATLSIYVKIHEHEFVAVCSYECTAQATMPMATSFFLGTMVVMILSYKPSISLHVQTHAHDL